MSVEQKIKDYISAIKRRDDLLQEIEKLLPPQLWETYQKAEEQLPSDKS